MAIIWKDVIGFEGFYKVSNNGNIKSVKHDIITMNKKVRRVIERYLTPYIDKGGYNVVVLTVDKKKYYKKVHRLVAEAFISNPNNYSYVNHINENKSDNRVENLEWCDVKYNNSYGTRLERCSKSGGTPIDVYLDGKYICTENSINVCVKKYKVGYYNIVNQLNNTRKKYYWSKSKYSFAYKGKLPIKNSISNNIIITFK